MKNFFLYYRRFVNVFGISILLMFTALALSYNGFILFSSFFVFLITIILVLISEIKRGQIIRAFYFQGRFKKMFHKKTNKFVRIKYIDNRGNVVFFDGDVKFTKDLSEFDLNKNKI